MRAAGVEIQVDQSELAVGGIFEVVTSAARVLRAWRSMQACARREQPDLVILVDSGGFNLPLAKRLRRVCDAPIFYYIAPQVWAWRVHRLQKLADRSDRIAVILPFEREFYREAGIEADFIGHPILDQIDVPITEDRSESQCSARQRLGLDATAPVLGLFPGSRRSEIGRHLALFVDSFRRLAEDLPELEAVLSRASSLDAEDFEDRLRRAAGDLRPRIHVVTDAPGDSLHAVDVSLAKPGTITVELLVRGCPMVVAGRVNPWTARIVRLSLRATMTAMPNLLVGEEIVPELIQEDARPEAIARALRPLFAEPERGRQIEALESARARLGSAGAAQRGAAIVEEMIGSASA